MTTKTARTTLASTNARIDGIEARLDRVLALLEGQAPAKTVRTRKPAAPAKPAAAPKRTAQPKADLGRKGWNRALTGLARSQGSLPGGLGASVYAYAVSEPVWAALQVARDGGLSPQEALTQVLASTKARKAFVAARKAA